MIKILNIFMDTSFCSPIKVTIPRSLNPAECRITALKILGQFPKGVIFSCLQRGELLITFFVSPSRCQRFWHSSLSTIQLAEGLRRTLCGFLAVSDKEKR